MAAPRFSIIIPTRQRADKLKYSLQTCLRQRYDDYEIIVCDNCSSPETHAVVEQADSRKIRYVRASQPLAMSDNWELAVSHARGEYLLLIGDDDGLLPYALAELDRLIRELDARVLRWRWVFYLWPDVNLEGQGNFLRVPLGKQLRLTKSRSAIEQVLGFQAGYDILPMLYNAVIHRSLLEEARQRCGKIFGSHCPDIYSAFLFAYLSGEYWSLEAPMSIAGLSGHSNGVAALYSGGSNNVARDFYELNKQAGLHLHDTLPKLPELMSVCIADSFQHVKDSLFPDDDSLSLDRRSLIHRCLQTLVVENDEQWQQALRLMSEALEDSPELLEWFNTACRDLPRPNAKHSSIRTEELGFDGSDLCLNAASLGANDIAAVAELTGNILNFDTGKSSSQIDKYNTPLQQQLQEKERVIQNLKLQNSVLQKKLAAPSAFGRSLRGAVKRAMETFSLRRAG